MHQNARAIPARASSSSPPSVTNSSSIPSGRGPSAGTPIAPHATRRENLTISSAKEARGRYMAIADTHVRSFYGSTIARSEFWNTLLRLDRVMMLDDGRGREKVDCLVGCVDVVDVVDDVDDGGGDFFGDGDSGGDGGPSNQSNWILSLLERALADESNAIETRRVVGAVTIDGNHRMKNRRVDRNRHAYIANLAVHPGYRRRGIAERLMMEAEARAREFGCRWVVLHVDERNVAGRRLYAKLGYRTVARQGWLEALVEGRGEGERLVLMVKLLVLVGGCERAAGRSE